MRGCVAISWAGLGINGKNYSSELLCPKFAAPVAPKGAKIHCKGCCCKGCKLDNNLCLAVAKTMTAQEIEARVNAALELIEEVANSTNVRFNNTMRRKLQKAEMILVTLTGIDKAA